MKNPTEEETGCKARMKYKGTQLSKLNDGFISNESFKKTHQKTCINK